MFHITFTIFSRTQRQHITFSVAKNISNCRYAASETTNFNLDFLHLFDNMNIPNEYLAKTEDIADQVSVKLCVSLWCCIYYFIRNILLTARKYFGLFWQIHLDENLCQRHRFPQTCWKVNDLLSPLSVEGLFQWKCEICRLLLVFYCFSSMIFFFAIV